MIQLVVTATTAEQVISVLVPTVAARRSEFVRSFLDVMGGEEQDSTTPLIVIDDPLFPTHTQEALMAIADYLIYFSPANHRTISNRLPAGGERATTNSTPLVEPTVLPRPLIRGLFGFIPGLCLFEKQFLLETLHLPQTMKHPEIGESVPPFPLLLLDVLHLASFLQVPSLQSLCSAYIASMIDEIIRCTPTTEPMSKRDFIGGLPFEAVGNVRSLLRVPESGHWTAEEAPLVFAENVMDDYAHCSRHEVEKEERHECTDPSVDDEGED